MTHGVGPPGIRRGRFIGGPILFRLRDRGRVDLLIPGRGCIVDAGYVPVLV
jgi:hypothetical protein